MNNSQLDAIEEVTLRRHAQAAVFESIFTSVTLVGGDIAVKGFDAEAWMVTLIAMAPGISQLMSLGLSRPMAHFGRRRMLRWAALLGRLPMFILLFVSGPMLFLSLLTLQAVAGVIITTSWNSLLRSNYRDAQRGRLYARAARIGALSGGLALVLSGYWLERDPEAYRYVFAIAAIAGVLSCFIFSEIQVRAPLSRAEQPGHSLRELWNTLVGDRYFLRFQLGFFLYGLAFMSISIARPLEMAGDDRLDFSYQTLLGARGVFSLSVLLSTLMMGRMLDRVGPATLAQRCYFLLAVYSGLLYFTYYPPVYFVAEALYGVSMAGITIAWNLGPVTMAPTAGAAANYMLVHVGLVGVRSLIGHPLAWLVIECTDAPRLVFLMGVVLFAAAGLTMVRLARELKKRPIPVPAPTAPAETIQ